MKPTVFRNVLHVVSKDVKVQFDMYAKIFKRYLLLFVSLFAACLFRYNLLSLIYFVYLLLLPWFQCPNKHTIKGRTMD